MQENNKSESSSRLSDALTGLTCQCPSQEHCWLCNPRLLGQHLHPYCQLLQTFLGETWWQLQCSWYNMSSKHGLGQRPIKPGSFLLNLILEESDLILKQNTSNACWQPAWTWSKHFNSHWGGRWWWWQQWHCWTHTDQHQWWWRTCHCWSIPSSMVTALACETEELASTYTYAFWYSYKLYIPLTKICVLDGTDYGKGLF